VQPRTWAEKPIETETDEAASQEVKMPITPGGLHTFFNASEKQLLHHLVGKRDP